MPLTDFECQILKSPMFSTSRCDWMTQTQIVNIGASPAATPKIWESGVTENTRKRTIDWTPLLMEVARKLMKRQADDPKKREAQAPTRGKATCYRTNCSEQLYNHRNVVCAVGNHAQQQYGKPLDVSQICDSTPLSPTATLLKVTQHAWYLEIISHRP